MGQELPSIPLNHPIERTRLIFVAAIFCALAIVLAALTPPGSAQGQAADQLTMTVKAGFDGKFKDNSWFPVSVELENLGGDLQGKVLVEFVDASGSANTYEYPIDLPSVSHKKIVLYVQSPGYSRTLRVRFLSGSQTLESVQIQLDNFASPDYWYGIIAGDPTAYNILSQMNTTSLTARLVALQISDLPDRSYVMKSFNVLVIANVNTGKLSAAQKQALADWVAAGGRLAIIGGDGWQETAAGLQGLGLLPLQPEGTSSVKALAGLQQFSRLPASSPEVEETLEVATGSLAKGAQVLAQAENGLPLVVRKAYGAGEVLFLTFNPAVESFKKWDGREDFFRQLFSSPLDKPSWLPGIRVWNQAEEAALTLPHFRLPSPLLICGFLMIYILALGPLNYFLVRYLKRSELGWVTVPVMVLFFTGLILVAGTLSRGSQVVLNRLAVVQVWEDVPRAKIDGVMGIYSPTRSTYQAEAASPVMLYPLLSDYGQPSGSYRVQETGTKTIIPELKLDISGIEPLAFEGSTPAPAFQHSLTFELGQEHAILKGELTNSSSLKLQEVVLLYSGGRLQVGDLEPGETFKVNEFLFYAQLAEESNLNPVYTYVTGYSTSFSSPYSLPTDSTISDILDTSNYYDDPEVYRKYLLLNAVTNSGYGTGSSRGAGVYLVGWTDQLPIQVGISESAYQTEDNLVYFIALKPSFPEQDHFTLTPGVYKWSLIEGTDYNFTPYNANIYPGTLASFQYTPIQPVAFSQVKSVTLHLENGDSTFNGNPATECKLSAWDFNTQTWRTLDDLRWGDNRLKDAGSLVDADGSLRLHVESAQSGYTFIVRADFTVEYEK